MKREKFYYLVPCDEISSSISEDLTESGLDAFIEAVDYEGTIYDEKEFLEAWNNCDITTEDYYLRIIEFQTCSCTWRGPVHHLIRRTETSMNQKEMEIEDCPSCGTTIKRQKI